MPKDPLFSKRIKALRASIGLSQSQFAGSVGVRLWTLRNWEQGRYVPEYADLISEALEARVKAWRKK